MISPRRRFLSASVLAPWAFAVLAGGARAADFTFKLGHNAPEDHPINVGAKEIADAVRRESNGRLEIQVFPNNQLGNDDSMLTQLRAGAMPMSLQSSGPLSELVPIAGMERIGFAFRTRRDALAAMDGDLGAQIRKDLLASKGIVAFEKSWEVGFRQFSNSVHPIKTVDDLNGLKLRIPLSKITVDMFKTLGAAPVPISANEIYTSLQTHVVDGADGAFINMLTLRYYEVQKYVSVTNHQWSAYWCIINADVWNSLPADLQTILRRNANAAGAREQDRCGKANDAGAAQLVKYGMLENVADTNAFRSRLAASGFYGRWKKEFGSAAWTALEKYTPPLG